MINVKNQTRTIKVNKKTIATQAQEILSILGYRDFDLGILLTTNYTIRRYNKEFRHKDKPTDILSFSYHADLKAGDNITPKMQEDKNIGDLIISLEYVKKDAQKYEQTFKQRMQVLLVHGICHLLGYDHESDSDYDLMHKQEQKILRKLGS